MTNRINNPEKLIPNNWLGVHEFIKTEADIIFLGSNNLEYLKQYWRREERQLADKIKSAQIRIDAFGVNNAKDLLKSLDELTAKKAEVGNYLRFLTKAAKQAEAKPCLAPHRPMDYFKIGDEVVCYISSHSATAIEKNTFVGGKVISGYRHKDGCVSVYADEKVHNDNYCDGHGLLYVVTSSCVMHKWEHEYLKNHPDFLKIWVKSVLESSTVRYPID